MIRLLFIIILVASSAVASPPESEIQNDPDPECEQVMWDLAGVCVTAIERERDLPWKP